MTIQSNDTQIRRKFPRRAIVRRVSLLCLGDYSLATSQEVGEGGMAFIADSELKVGSRLVVNFRIPGGEFVSLRAIVRTCVSSVDGLLHGISFDNIPFASKRQIRSYVSSRGDHEDLRV